MPITFLRHAQSNGNLGNPAKDSTLSQTGIEQARKLSGDFDLVICSTLKRTRQTLDESQIIYRDIAFTDLCRENLDGNPNSNYNGEDVCAENNEQIVNRVNLFVDYLKEKEKQYSKILVVSHCLFLQSLTGYFFHNCNVWTVTSADVLKKR